MDMVFNETSAEDGCTKFPAFAQKIFQSSTWREKPAMLRCFELIYCVVSVLRDCQYNSSILEHNLKAILGHQRRIFDVATTNPAGCRVAIITSRSSDGKACVFANYRGIGHRNPNAAYQFLIPQNEDQNPFLWEVWVLSLVVHFKGAHWRCAKTVKANSFYFTEGHNAVLLLHCKLFPKFRCI